MVGISSIKGKGDQPAKKEKAVHIKLSKEQKLYVNDLLRLENRVAVCREYIGMWTNFFRFFGAEDITQKEIKPEEEKQFFQILTMLARKHFMFVEMMADTFDRGNEIMEVLSRAVSLAYIQAMPENTRSKFELDWHGLLLDMNKALGRLLRKMPTTKTLTEQLAELDGLAPVAARPDAASPDQAKAPEQGKGWLRRKAKAS